MELIERSTVIHFTDFSILILTWEAHYDGYSCASANFTNCMLWGMCQNTSDRVGDLSTFFFQTKLLSYFIRVLIVFIQIPSKKGIFYPFIADS